MTVAQKLARGANASAGRPLSSVRELRVCETANEYEYGWLRDDGILGKSSRVFAALRLLTELSEYAVRRSLETRVRFIGYVGGSENACALQSCELLVIPSRREAMSIAALEAGSHGKPVLLTDQCGFNEVEQVGGGRVARATATSIENALMQMAANPDELTLMGARLKAFVQQQYTWGQAVAKHLALFQQIVGSVC